ncbi:MAG: N-acetyl-gamma-glutamyl-phosphate reductase [Oscillospiraceae bacterium]|nr:N-acetyl-gamma-glutamyl-phosphate reductase [Oscillospiraceae bacterium]
MKPKIFIDGREGTTGLQLFDRLGRRSDIEMLLIEEQKRKDASARKKMINEADIVFLCLPDEASKESVSLIENEKTRVIDASTAHRTDPDWAYGFPELSKKRREEIAKARWVANPGCHSTGIIAAAYPLIELGIMPCDYPLTCTSLTGYSGGGKTMIHAYESSKTPEMSAPRIYGLELRHKHLPEIISVTGLSRPPVFCPIVDDYYCGIAATIALHNDLLDGIPSASDILRELSNYYAEERFVTVAPELGSGMLESSWGAGTNMLELTVSGNAELTIVTARLDNLGKGASGAAVQNMNIMLGMDEGKGLE